MPRKTICLTFDDGPGEHTLEISTYLKEQDIKATFFLIGSFVDRRKADMLTLLSDGHLIGNHTQHHRSLDSCDDAAVLAEIINAHQSIETAVAGTKPLFFRAPYGWWNSRAYQLLNEYKGSNGAHLNEIYCGPVHWDIDGQDWKYWHGSQGPNDEEALNKAIKSYEVASERTPQGVVLMHDNSFEYDIQSKNQTFRMIKRLVPLWKNRGFRFVQLDEVLRFWSSPTGAGREFKA